MLEAAELGSAIPKAEYEEQVPALRVALVNTQYQLRKAGFAVVLLLAGDDVRGCNELLGVLHEWMDARYLPTHAFGPPRDEERERPRFWRYWRILPGDGEFAILFGAWATTAIAERVERRIDRVGFERRLDRIERFERTLVDDGTLLLKFWIHLPRKELAKRLKKARKRGQRGRIDEAEWRVYERYDAAVSLVEQLLRRTSSAGAPWQLVEGTDPRHRNLSVARSLLAALQARLESDAAPPAGPGPVPPAFTGVPGSATPLDAVDLTCSLAYDDYKKQLDKLQARLGRLSSRSREAGLSSVLVFEGWDAAGKGGVIRRITRALDARDYRVVAVAAPSQEEKAHHYLWRFWRRLPRAGQLVLFDRSWYGRLLVERVEGLTREDEWRRAFAEINDFEDQLAEHGTVVLKFWLHIDPDEQLRRFRARESTPYKKYKITPDDYRNRGRWEDYEAAVNEMVARTSSERAPWHLVPANDKRWARVRVLAAICGALGEALEKR